MSEPLTDEELILHDIFGPPSGDEAKHVWVRLVAEIRRLRAQIPPTMQNCTILFKQCAKGHGWLTATNWVQHGCSTCEMDALRAEIADRLPKPS